jgi:hypothetical protein
MEHCGSTIPAKAANVSKRPLRALRANHVSCTDEKRIRAGNMVMNKGKSGLVWLLSKIADCVRMCLSSAQSAIRADGTPSAPARPLQAELSFFLRPTS